MITAIVITNRLQFPDRQSINEVAGRVGRKPRARASASAAGVGSRALALASGTALPSAPKRRGSSDGEGAADGILIRPVRATMGQAASPLPGPEVANAQCFAGPARPRQIDHVSWCASG